VAQLDERVRDALERLGGRRWREVERRLGCRGRRAREIAHQFHQPVLSGLGISWSADPDDGRCH
jgi:hypothetical protein